MQECDIMSKRILTTDTKTTSDGKADLNNNIRVWAYGFIADEEFGINRRPNNKLYAVIIPDDALFEGL